MILKSSFCGITLFALIAGMFTCASIFAQRADSLAKLTFLTTSSTGQYNINFVEPGRGTLSMKATSFSNIDDGSISWNTWTDKKLLTFSMGTALNNAQLAMSIIGYTPSFSLKTILLPEEIKNEYGIKKWIALNPTTFFAASTNSIYYIVLGSASQTKIGILHKSTQSQTSAVSSLVFDLAKENLVFSYAGGPVGSDKVFYSYNFATKKISSVNTASFCKGSITFVNKTLLAVGPGELTYLCNNGPSIRPSFVVINFPKLNASVHETKLVFSSDSSIAVDPKGNFIHTKNASDRIEYCSGNIKDVQSIKCLYTSMINNGNIYPSGVIAQFLLIESKNISILDLSSSVPRRTSIFFSSPLSGKILGPVAL